MSPAQREETCEWSVHRQCAAVPKAFIEQLLQTRARLIGRVALTLAELPLFFTEDALLLAELSLSLAELAHARRDVEISCTVAARVRRAVVAIRTIYRGASFCYCHSCLFASQLALPAAKFTLLLTQFALLPSELSLSPAELALRRKNPAGLVVHGPIANDVLTSIALEPDEVAATFTQRAENIPATTPDVHGYVITIDDRVRITIVVVDLIRIRRLAGVGRRGECHGCEECTA
jgi:hypothetical protein